MRGRTYEIIPSTGKINTDLIYRLGAIASIKESMESLYEKVSEKYYKEELYGHEV